jgi:hypothetical protein
MPETQPIQLGNGNSGPTGPDASRMIGGKRHASCWSPSLPNGSFQVPVYGASVRLRRARVSRKCFVFKVEGVGEAGLRELAELRIGEAHLLSGCVFGSEIRVEHGGVVSGKNDGDAVPEELW